MTKIITNNYTILISFLIIMIISFLNMHILNKNTSFFSNYLSKQILWYLIGILIIIIINKLNTKSLFKYSKILYLLSMLLLFIVLFSGRVINGSKAWIIIGKVSFQPSELVKITLALFLANYVSNYKIHSLKDEMILIIKVIIYTLIPSILVFLEPDTGAIIFYFVIAFTILLLKGIKKRWFIIFITLFLIILIIFIILYLYNKELLIQFLGTSVFYRIERIIDFQNQNSYQLNQAIIAIGSAPFLKLNMHNLSLYIPEASTDFIFASTIKNFGLLIGLIILLCYFLIDLYLLITIDNIKSQKIKLFLSSLTNVFIVGQLINIMMNIGLIPIIGIPLPFLSYGGTTILMYSIFFGLTISFNKNSFKIS